MMNTARVEMNDSPASSDGGTERAHRHARAALHRSVSRSGRVPALLPAESFGAAADAIFQTITRIRQLIVILAREVFQTELDRVDLQLVRDVIHQRLDAEDALRISRPAEVRGDRHVGVDGVNRSFDVRALIQLNARDAARALAVRAHAAVAAQLDGRECAIVFDADLV